MKVELHILQNFAPSNLNRDDTGAPKDCELGGYRRARVSSQCLKRAVRDAFEVDGLFAPTELAVRTKRLVENVADQLASAHGRDRDQAIERVTAALAGVRLKVKGAAEDYRSEYLLFLPKRHLGELAGVVQKHWKELETAAESDPEPSRAPAKPTTAKNEKAEKKGAFPSEIAKELGSVLKDAARTPDLALFGRMIADEPEWNVDAACQVAHAVSTNRAAMEFDFYTAVDDLRPADTAGSEMMGTVQFNSSCFYRYSVLDVNDLDRNLGGDGDLLKKTVGAYIRASVLAIPTGKQNSMAAHNPPSFVLAIVRRSGTAVSLANAFLQPAQPKGDTDLVTVSIDKLLQYLREVSRMYGIGAPTPARKGADGGLTAFYIADRKITSPDEPISLVDKGNLGQLVQGVGDVVAGTPG